MAFDKNATREGRQVLAWNKPGSKSLIIIKEHFSSPAAASADVVVAVAAGAVGAVDAAVAIVLACSSACSWWSF